MPTFRYTRLDAASTCAAALVALHFAVLGVARPLLRPDPYSDFATFYSAARCFAQGTNPYDPAALRSTESFPGWVGRYLYPPPFAAVVVRPLLGLPFATARRVWVIAEAAAYVAAAWLACGLAALPRAARLVVAGAGALAYAPIFLDLRLGSVSGILLLCAVLGLRARARAQPLRAGAWLALAVVLKLAPALVLVYCLARREWRLLAAAIATAIAVAAVCLPWTGVAAYRTWIVDVVPVLLRESFGWFTNQSLDAFFWRLFVPNPDTTPWSVNPALYRTGVALVTTAVLALLVLAARRAGRLGGRSETLAVTMVLAAVPLLSRVAWEYLFVLVLPCFFVWADRARGGIASRRSLVAVGLAWFLCAAPFAYERHPPRQGVALLLAAPRTYGALLLLVVSASAFRAQRSSTKRAATTVPA